MNAHDVGREPAGRRRRTLAGRLLTLALLPVLLGVLACIELPVPVGNPERSRIDPALSGMWYEIEDGEAAILLLEAWDKRTWLATWLQIDCEQAGCLEDGIVSGLADHDFDVDATWINKAWLTKLGGERFMTWETKLLGDEDTGQTPQAWWVFRVSTPAPDELRLVWPDPSFQDLNKSETRRDAERILRRNARNPELYGVDEPGEKEQSFDFRRLPQAAWGDVRDMLDENDFEPE